MSRANDLVWDSSAAGRLEDLGFPEAETTDGKPTPTLKVVPVAKLRVERYSDSQQSAWDEFVGRGKNRMFMFNRGYMDYHRDRFDDHSLLVHDENRVVALLPANRKENILVTHGGLTYGGFITDEHMKVPLMLRVFDTALSYCREQGISEVRYKAIPSIYQRIPAQEDLYALHLCNATVIDRSVMAVVPLHERPSLSKGRRSGVSKARNNGLTVRRTEDLGAYWHVLEERLHERHGTGPVHTLAEMELLHSRYPDNIKLYACYEGTAMVAGVLIFENDQVAKTQYIAANQRGREMCALDLLFDHLLKNAFSTKLYFDFGTSHDPTTNAINGGLLFQKESFGGRAIMQDVYSIDLKHWNAQHLRTAFL